jgi:hypothetical protein
VTRTTVGGKSSGRQIVGWRFAGPSGSRTKGQPPATGDFRLGRFLGDDARCDALKRSPIVFLVFGIAPQKFPSESCAIEFLQGIARILRAPIHRSWHAWPSPFQGPAGPIRASFWRRRGPASPRGSNARRRGYLVRQFGALSRFSCQNSGVIVGADAKDCGSPPASSSAPARDDCHGPCGRVPVRDLDPRRR